MRDLFTKFADSYCGFMLYDTVSSGKRVQTFRKNGLLVDPKPFVR